jgi:hypothetical protein
VAAIERLAIVNPSANTANTAFTSDSTFLVSVIATNKSTTENALISVWVSPLGVDSEGGRGYVAYNLPLSVSNTYETIRFPIINTDQVRVQASTANVSFIIAGIDQLDV